jgi:hypothetical protein
VVIIGRLEQQAVNRCVSDAPVFFRTAAGARPARYFGGGGVSGVVPGVAGCGGVPGSDGVVGVVAGGVLSGAAPGVGVVAGLAGGATAGLSLGDLWQPPSSVHSSTAARVAAAGVLVKWLIIFPLR